MFSPLKTSLVEKGEKAPLLSSFKTSKHPGIGQRHVVSILAGLGIMTIYWMRVNMSVAMVAMVNSTAVFNQEFQRHNITPQSACATGNTSSQETSPMDSGGSFVWSRKVQGAIFSAFYWGGLLLQFPAAVIAQRYGAKWLFGLGILWSSVLTTLVPVVAHLSPGLLIALRAAQGIGEGVVYPALNCLLGLWVPPDEASLLTTIAFEGDALGLIIGQAISGPLCASAWGWPSSFLVSGGVGIVWFVLWALLTSDSPEKHHCISTEELRFIVDSLDADTDDTQGPRSVPWRQILTDPAVWANIVANFALYWVFFTLLTCLPQFFSDVLCFDIATDGLQAALPNVFCFLVSLITAYLTDRAVAAKCVARTRIRKILCFVAFSGTAAAIVGAALVSHNVIATVVLLNLALSALGLLGGGLTPNVFDLSPEFSGVIEAIGNSFVIVAGISATYITDALTVHGLEREWDVVFYIGACVSLFGGAFFVLFGSADRRVWSTEEK